MKKKGFTLIELLGVIVVLTLILLVAIPNISSTLERNKNKTDSNKEKNVISAAEVSFSVNKCDYSNACVIGINCLLANDFVTDDELLYSDGSSIADKYNVVAYNIDGQKNFELKKSSEVSGLSDCCFCD